MASVSGISADHPKQQKILVNYKYLRNALAPDGQLLASGPGCARTKATVTEEVHEHGGSHK
jgi:hypothetical protein